jgi:Crinkler effector protein N-terminal domain
VTQHPFLDDDALLEADILSDIFHPEPTKKTLHIVVRSPRVGECPPSVPELVVIRSVSHAGSSVPQSSIFTLNCWVLLEGVDRVFPVEIAKEKSVGALKDAIKDKKKPDFHHIPADKLTLWKVSL